jgi:opacity protein-like surface antigen
LLQYNSTAFFWNFRYSFDDQFGVYGGAGAGVIYGKLSGTGANLTTGANSSFSDSDLAFAITGNIGAFYNVNENITVKGGFRYLDTTDFKFDVNAGRTKVKLDSSIWELGMDYNF